MNQHSLTHSETFTFTRVPVPTGAIPAENRFAAEQQFQRHVTHLHQLGARAVGALLLELEREHDIGADIRQRLATYAALAPEAVYVTWGEKWPEPPLHRVEDDDG